MADHGKLTCLPTQSRSAINRKQGLRTVSTKGCFLWMAARPGRYSKTLYDTARTTGLTDGYGFASGIYENTHKATLHSDVNTNGIILESILYILSGSKPAITLHQATLFHSRREYKNGAQGRN